MSQFPEITSNLSTANFRASVLTQLNKGIEIANDSGSPIPVTISGSTGATDYELVVSTYTCKTAFTGASVGDIITETQIIAITGGVASTLQTIWRNQTTATDLSSAPSSVNLALEGTTALTQAQLQATAVAATQSGTWSVGVNNFPASYEISNDVGNPIPVSGSFYQATQPVSGTVTANVQGGNSTAVKVDGSAVTQPVSGTVSVSGTLPAGTNAIGSVGLNAGTNLIGKVGIDQTTPGTTNAVSVGSSITSLPAITGAVTTNAGTNTSTANLDVALSTRLKPADTLAAVTTVGSVTTLPAITGTVTANAGTNLNTSALALESGGHLASVDSKLTSGVPVTGSFYQATQPVSLASLPALAAGNAIAGKFGIDQTTPGTTNNVTVTPQLGGLTQATGTLTAATSAVALAAATATKYLAIQNNSTAVIYCNFNAAATTASMQIAAGATYIFEADYLVNTSINLYSVAGTSAGATYVITYA